MDLSRNQWRELLRQINKGGLPKFKEFISNVEDASAQESYKCGIADTVDAVKQAVLGSVEEVLHSDFGFGQKRMNKFADAFEIQLEKNSISEETKVS